MNPMTNIKNVQKLNERELELGMIGKKSWHDDYKDSAWVFIGGLPYDLSEGDIICVFSQYGEVVNLNLVRDHKTGKSKGFAFLCFEDQRSTVLSVDNLNAIKILGRTIRVDHVKDYKVPKEHENDDELIRKMREEGCAPSIEDSPVEGQDEELGEDSGHKAKQKKKKGDKKKKKKKKNRSRDASSDSTNSGSEEDRSDRKVKTEPLDIKQEKEDKGYDKALNSSKSKSRRSVERERENGFSSQNSRKKKYGRHSSNEKETSHDVRGGRDVSQNNSHQEFLSHRRDREVKQEKGKDRYRDNDRERYNDRDRYPQSREDRERHRDRDNERERHRERSRSREAERDRRGGRDKYR